MPARKAIRADPCRAMAATRTPTPVTRPVSTAVPVQSATARRQVGTSVPLNRTSSGSVDRPREAFRQNE